MKRHQIAFATIAAAAAIVTTSIATSTIQQTDQTASIRQTLLTHPEIIMAAIQEGRQQADQQQQDALMGTATPLARKVAADHSSPSWMGKADGRDVVEFYDLNCGHCKAFGANTMLPMLKAGDPVRFRLVDVAILGPGSTRLAQMEAAAGLQGRDQFVRGHAFLTEQHAATAEDADALADRFVAAARLDRTSFDKAMKDGSAARIVQRNHDEAVAAGIHGTPTIWGRQGIVQGETTIDRVKQISGLAAL